MTRGIVAVFCLILAGAARAAAAPPPLEDYGKLPAADQISLSPDGQNIAFEGFDGAKRFIGVRKLGGPLLVAFNAGDQKVRSIDWLDDRHVMVRVDTFLNSNVNFGSGFIGGWRGNFAESIIVDATTGKAFRVFAGKRNIVQSTFAYFGTAKLGGRSYGYFAGLTLIGSGAAMANFDSQQFSLNHGHVDLYRVDLDTGEPSLVQPGSDQVDSGWIVDRSGAVVARADYDQLKGVETLYSGAGDVITHLSDPTGDSFLTAQGRAAGTIAVQVVDGDNWRLVEYGLDGKTGPTPLFPQEDIRALLQDRRGLLIGGITGDRRRVLLFDPVEQARFDAASRPFAGETITLESYSDDFTKIILRTEGAGDSGTYFLADLNARKVEAIAWEYPTILQDAVGPVRTLSYKAQDGLALEGILTLPPGREAKNLPVVILPHGGPQARDYQRFDWLAQAFASRGYAVFQPNFRGSDGYGKAFRDAGLGQWGRKMQTDVSDGLAELARQGIVDPKRACIVGASYGGYVALAGVTLQHGLYRCAVADAPVSDLPTILNRAEGGYKSNNIETRYWHAYMGVKDAGDPVARELSPARHAAEADAPILLIHGKQDTTVDPEQSAIMRRALTAAGKPFEFVELVGEDHYLSKAATRTQMLSAAVAFVEKYNPPT